VVGVVEEWFEESFRELRRELRRLLREAERLFEPVVDAERGEVEPLYEVVDAGDKVLVRVDLPKASKEAVEVSIVGRRLVVRASLREPLRLCDVPYYARCEVSGYRLELELPPDVDAESAQATFRSGYLEVTIPRRRSFRVKVE
jgi:HSP20 family protein